MLLFLILQACLTSPVEEEKVQLSTFSSCSSANAMLKNASYQYSPNPIVKGQKVSIIVTGEIVGVVNRGAKVKVDLTRGGSSVLNRELDLCDEAKEFCPAKGKISVTKTFDIPFLAPRGEYIGRFLLVNDDKTEIACVNSRIYL